MTECPLCGGNNLEYTVGEHVSKLRGAAQQVPQTICHDCGEGFLGPDSLKVIRAYELPAKRMQRKRKHPELRHA